MTTIDWLIIVFALLLAPFGYRQGMTVGLLSLGGFVAGAFLGARLGPLVLSDGSDSAYAPAAALLGGVLVGGVLSAALEGFGLHLQQRFVTGPKRARVDAAGGAVVFVVLGLAVSWVVGAVVLNTPDLKEYRKDVQRSEILSSLYDSFPPSGPLLNVLNDIDLTPQLRGPSADVKTPPKRILQDPEMLAASESVVRVLGTACGLNISGSGWVAGPGLVVTNAHVIAGQDDTIIRTKDGTEHDAVAVGYRTRDDVAVLSVPSLELPAIPLAGDPQQGKPGAVVGYPGAGDFSIVPARLGSTGTVTSQDSYGRGQIMREMTSFRAEVVSGNSGGPVISGAGEVLTTVFASAISDERSEALGVPNSVTAELLGRVDGGEVDTGPCA